ncbi:hypothetical protein ISREJYDI_CDS0002 [Pseudomonas phage UNO-G1W1]|uniref:Uncharacterized protein n=1 Tax=Pseudomonas phage UNO-G1W1 TaxID=3136609 RepID=A0AAX4QMX8_9CAUD
MILARQTTCQRFPLEGLTHPLEYALYIMRRK